VKEGVMENPVPAPEEITAAEMVAAREKAGKSSGEVWVLKRIEYRDGMEHTDAYFVVDDLDELFLTRGFQKIGKNIYIKNAGKLPMIVYIIHNYGNSGWIDRLIIEEDGRTHEIKVYEIQRAKRWQA